MSEHKHTPGPWDIDKYYRVIDKNGMEIRVCGVSLSSRQDLAVKANTNLIAAAPELLEALEKAREDINWMLNSGQSLNGHVFDYIDGAIAKATGATHE